MQRETRYKSPVNDSPGTHDHSVGRGTSMLRSNLVPILAALCLLLPRLVHAQQTQTAEIASISQGTFALPATNLAIDAETSREADSVPIKKVPWFKRAEGDLVFEGLASYGHYNIFAIKDNTKIDSAGVEYDRHSWGNLIGARIDYVAEFLPFVLLGESTVSDYFGNPGPNRKYVPGIGIYPIGVRMMWLSKKPLKPYILVKGGMLGFTQKALSKYSSYEQFSLQSSFGVQTRLTRRWDLRLGLWGDFHFSNGFLTPSNPGTDVMNANWGLAYHIGKQE